MFENIFHRLNKSKLSIALSPPTSEKGTLILKPAVVFKQVVKTFHTPAGDFTALKGVDLRVSRGEFMSIVGKSGSGKSTLINLIAGIDRLSQGEIIVCETPLQQLSEGEITIWRGRNIGIVFQFFQLLPTLTAVENIMLAMDYGRIYSPQERPARAMYLLEQVNLVDVAHRLPSQLSGGQQQCVAIMRALANDPPILVADEPTGNLDTISADMVFSLFTLLATHGKTMIIVTHDNDLAIRTARTLVIADGLIVDDIIHDG